MNFLYSHEIFICNNEVLSHIKRAKWIPSYSFLSKYNNSQSSQLICDSCRQDYGSCSIFPNYDLVAENLNKINLQSTNGDKNIKVTVMQTEKSLINGFSLVSKVSWKLNIPTVYEFALIYLWNLLFS